MRECCQPNQFSIRLPVGWQYLVNHDSSSKSLEASFFAQYDKLVQAVTSTGAYAIIDIHNYGRWNSGVIGVDGPSNDDFARLWSLLAAKYADNDKVMFGIMNEPHDQDTNVLATTIQAAVNAIRKAGATSQTIIIPGNSWDNAKVWASGANAPILEVTDPAGGVDKLLLDVHKYIDGDGSGTSHECTNNGLDMLEPLVAYLKQQGRRAIVTEIGGAVTDSCLNYLPQTMEFIANNEEQIVGFTAWSAGSFQPYPNYELSLTPNADGSDNDIFLKAIKPFLPGANAAPIKTTAASSTAPAKTSTVAQSSAAAESSGAPVETFAPVESAAPNESAAPVQSSASAPAVSPAVSSASSQRPSSKVTETQPIPSSTAAATPASSSASSERPSSKVTETQLVPTSAAPAPATSSAAPVDGNLQTFTEALGGIAAPPVTAEGMFYRQSGQRYNFLIDALNQSCYVQMDKCQLAANKGGNKAPLTVENCNGTQIQACLKAAQATAH